MNIKTIGIILIAVLFLTGTGASTQCIEWDITGTWECKTTWNGTPLTTHYEIIQNGQNFVGTWTGPYNHTMHITGNIDGTRIEKYEHYDGHSILCIYKLSSDGTTITMPAANAIPEFQLVMHGQAKCKTYMPQFLWGEDISKKITEHQSVFDILKDKAPEGATIDDITFDLPPSFDKELVGTEATWIPEVGKTAYVFNDLSGWEHIITGPKRHHIANYFKDMGYTVFTVDATNKNFDSMLTDTNTGAIAYFGHGGEPAIGFREVSTVQSQARVAKITKYMKEGLSFKDAKEKAESETIQFDYIYNHACYSMGSDDKKDTNVGDELLRPGGIYWGKQGILRAYQPLQTYIKPK